MPSPIRCTLAPKAWRPPPFLLRMLGWPSSQPPAIPGRPLLHKQEHFYLEPNASLVIPGEGGEVTSFSSSQCPDKHHRYLAHVLGLPMHKVTVRTKRLGGGFGGKETRSAFVNAAAAVPAHLLRRPVRICLDRDEDMHITGQRHAFAAKYRIGLSSAGEIRALDVDIYNNAGYSLDLSFSIMDRALTHIDSVYRIPAIRAQARGWQGGWGMVWGARCRGGGEKLKRCIHEGTQGGTLSLSRACSTITRKVPTVTRSSTAPPFSIGLAVQDQPVHTHRLPWLRGASGGLCGSERDA